MQQNQHTETLIAGISSMATRYVLLELAEFYEGVTGQRVMIESVGGVEAAGRVENGELFDFTVLASDAIERLFTAGRLVPKTRVDVARSDIAIAVAAGAAHPAVDTEEKLREAVASAGRIGYSTGPSGVHLTRLFERWGVSGRGAPRFVQAPPGMPVGQLLVRGEVDLGFQQLSELIHLPGIEIVGSLPSDVQSTTVFSAAICAVSSRQEAAKQFLAFVSGRQADAIKRENGMEPC